MSVVDTMELIDQFLTPFSEKEAAEQGTSNQDSVQIKDLEMNDDVSADQTNLGKEQKQDAKDGGMNIEDQPANTDADKEDDYDKETPKKLDVDQTTVGNSESIGNVQKQEIGMEQKTAELEKLGNAVLAFLEKDLVQEKEASQSTDPADEILQKLAAVSAEKAQDFYESHLLGQIKRLQDTAEVSSLGLAPEVLNK